MYTWGAGETGELGHSEERNGYFPRLVDVLTDVVVGQISLGEHHSVALSSGPGFGASDNILEWR
eukprot:SAG31_NODE_25451_length_461_cov_0.853591_1_plen_63_part_10